MIESWVASTQNWMNARFADWDTRSPQFADCVIVNDYYDVGRLASRPAQFSPSVAAPKPPDGLGPPIAPSATAAHQPALQDARSATGRPVLLTGKRTSFEPIVVDEQLSLDIAYELNFQSQEIGLVPPVIVRKPVHVRFDPVPVVGRMYREVHHELAELRRTVFVALPETVFQVFAPRLAEPMAVAKNASGRFADKLIALGQGIGINPAVAGAPRPVLAFAQPAVVTAARRALSSETSFRLMETSASLYFAGELTPLAQTELRNRECKPQQSWATPVASLPPRSTVATESQELPDDLSIEVAGELERQDDGFGACPPARTALVIAAKPAFDPIEVECDYEVGIAFELNSRNDGLNMPAEPVVQTTKNDLPAPQSAREISRAVQLTRDAVYAWVNIFTGPALLTVSQRN